MLSNRHSCDDRLPLGDGERTPLDGARVPDEVSQHPVETEAGALWSA